MRYYNGWDGQFLGALVMFGFYVLCFIIILPFGLAISEARGEFVSILELVVIVLVFPALIVFYLGIRQIRYLIEDLKIYFENKRERKNKH